MVAVLELLGALLELQRAAKELFGACSWPWYLQPFTHRAGSATYSPPSTNALGATHIYHTYIPQKIGDTHPFKILLIGKSFKNLVY